jgi:uncharacterized membrane protein (UPF0127 family)
VSTRARLALAAAIALMSAVGIGVVVARWVTDDAPAPVPIALRTAKAAPPFAGYREARVAFGSRCVRVVIADTDERRANGLRDVNDLGPYAGMLFVQSGDSEAAFTMSGVTRPLDIAWFAAGGAPVGATRMAPCPEADAGCPLYRAERSYHFALETPAGASPQVSVSPCV